MHKIELKTPTEIATMARGGRKLARIKEKLQKAVKVGVSAFEIEKLASTLIIQTGGQPSFKMVPGYSWSTCINVNDGVVHGIPKKEVIFKNRDLVSIDVGLFYEGFHTDTSMTVLIGKDKSKEEFLAIGKKALAQAIKRAKPGGFVEDISAAIEKTLRANNLEPIRDLVGHGIGRNLHEAPAVPCFVGQVPKIELKEGLVLAIEVMYSQGSGRVTTDKDDGWTIRTLDGKIAGLFEETVALTKNGSLVLTAP